MDPGACGTDAGYQRHQRAGPLPACGPCLAAHRAVKNDDNDALRLLGHEHPQRVGKLTAMLLAAGVPRTARWEAARRLLAREHPERYRRRRRQLKAARAAGHPGQVS